MRRVERTEEVQAPVTDSEAQAASTVGRKRSGGGFSRPVDEAAGHKKGKLPICIRNMAFCKSVGYGPPRLQSRLGKGGARWPSK